MDDLSLIDVHLYVLEDAASKWAINSLSHIRQIHYMRRYLGLWALLTEILLSSSCQSLNILKYRELISVVGWIRLTVWGSCLVLASGPDKRHSGGDGASLQSNVYLTYPTLLRPISFATVFVSFSTDWSARWGRALSIIICFLYEAFTAFLGEKMLQGLLGVFWNPSMDVTIKVAQWRSLSTSTTYFRRHINTSKS